MLQIENLITPFVWWFLKHVIHCHRHGFGASAPALLWLVWPCGSSGELETRRPVGRVHGSFCCGTWILWIWMMRKQAVTKTTGQGLLYIYIIYIYMFMHVYCPCILRMFMWRSKKVFRACEVFIIFVILLIEILFREPAARRCDQTEHCRRWGCRRSCLCSSQALRPFAAELALVFSCCRQLQQSWFAMWFPAYQWRGWILNLSLTNQTCLLVLRYFGTVFGYPFWQGLLAQRAIQRGPPTAPRRPRRGRPVPKPVQERTPRLPPLSDDVWKPEPVAEEEVLLATKVDGQSLKDVAAEVSWWRLFFSPTSLCVGFLMFFVTVLYILHTSSCHRRFWGQSGPIVLGFWYILIFGGFMK